LYRYTDGQTDMAILIVDFLKVLYSLERKINIFKI